MEPGVEGEQPSPVLARIQEANDDQSSKKMLWLKEKEKIERGATLDGKGRWWSSRLEIAKSHESAVEPRFYNDLACNFFSSSVTGASHRQAGPNSSKMWSLCHASEPWVNPCNLPLQTGPCFPGCR